MHIQLIILPQKIKLLNAPFSKAVRSFRDGVLLAPAIAPSLVRAKMSSKLRLSFYHGLYKELCHHGPRETVVVSKKTLLPNPLFPFTWGKFFIGFKQDRLHAEVFDGSWPLEQMPLLSYEDELRAEPQTAEYNRIKNIVASELKELEVCKTYGSILLKHLKSELFWQFTDFGPMDNFKTNDLLLSQITPTQWSYEFIIEKELKREGQGGGYKDLYDALEDGPSHKICGEEDCQRPRAKFSGLCRDHHFEAITGRPYAEMQKGPLL